MYTIILISYNEEKYILKTLESIRYQVQHYGEGRSFQLIVADDCSVDQTQNVVRFWLSKYESLFERVDCIFQEKNVGTCRNVASALRMIKGDLFYSVAGDDLLSSTDIFSVLERNKGIDVLSTPALVMRDWTLSQKKSDYRDIFAQSLYTSEYIAWAVGLGCPNQVGTIWNCRVNTEEMITYMESYHLLDDRPRFYAIWKNEQPVTYRFENIPLIIYGKNEFSVSQKTGIHLSAINTDLYQFQKAVYEDQKGLWNKFCAGAQMLSVQLRGKRVVGGIRYLSPYYLREQLLRLVGWKKRREMFRQMKETYILCNQKMVDEVVESANKLQHEFLQTS